MHRIARAQVNHLHTAARLCLARLEVVIQRQAAEGPVAARLGQAYQRVVPMEIQATHVTGTKRQWHKTPGLHFYVTKLARA